MDLVGAIHNQQAVNRTKSQHVVRRRGVGAAAHRSTTKASAQPSSRRWKAPRACGNSQHRGMFYDRPESC
eukprot:365826-Chlamydomonas_euryale.AAC.6